MASAGPYASLHHTLDKITTPAPHDLVFTGRMPFLPPNQQRQSTEQMSMSATAIVRLTVTLILLSSLRTLRSPMTENIMTPTTTTVLRPTYTLAGTSSYELEDFAGASFTACMPLLTATCAFGLGRRCWSSPQLCNLHCLRTLSSYFRHLSAAIFKLLDATPPRFQNS